MISSVLSRLWASVGTVNGNGVAQRLPNSPPTDSPSNTSNDNSIDSGVESPTDYQIPVTFDEGDDFGDYVCDSDEEDDLEESVEPWYNYDASETENVFYPISLGEVLNGRYRVEHKLGAGGCSTVWMAKDIKTNKDVALKVMARGTWGENELRVQEDIKKNVADTSRLVTSLATFMLPGDSEDENSPEHRVLVFPLVGPCLDPYVTRKMPMAKRMSAARQALEALEKLQRAGIVHRDVNERNFMWGVKPLDNLTRAAKYEALGRPKKQIIPELELWKQGELVAPLEVPEILQTDELYLGDFGLAKKLGTTHTERGYPPPAYTSPDRLHGKEPSFACDMWSYGALFCQLYLRSPLFRPHVEGGSMGSIVKCLGPFPQDWKGSYIWSGARDEWYDQTQAPDPEHTVMARLAWCCPDIDEEERGHVVSILEKLFTYDLKKRITATELLKDPSFKFIMAKYGC